MPPVPDVVYRGLSGLKPFLRKYSFFLQHPDNTVFFTSFKELYVPVQGPPTNAICGSAAQFFDILKRIPVVVEAERARGRAHALPWARPGG